MSVLNDYFTTVTTGFVPQASAEDMYRQAFKQKNLLGLWITEGNGREMNQIFQMLQEN